MASLASTSTTNSEPKRQSSLCSISTIIADLQQSEENSRSFSSMDDFLNNIYPDQPPPQPQHQQLQLQPEASGVGARSVDDVWTQLVAGGSDRRLKGEGDGDGDGGGVGEITLEDYLSKNGVVREGDVGGAIGYGQFPMAPSQGVEAPIGVYGNASGTAARGKRRVVGEPLDKATQQKQKRMIKNRESAARSRERKHAYTMELEAQVKQLEEENEKLLEEVKQRKKERLKQ
ncbi:hypothetical protein UlMin_044021, partial [Ulmus minor]